MRIAVLFDGAGLARLGLERAGHAGDYLDWSLKLPHPVLWVENVTAYGRGADGWGTTWNAAQFERVPRQNRNRVVGGRYHFPPVHHPYRRWFPGVCPTVTATEYKASGATDKCRASRHYGRNLTLGECSWLQGFDVPDAWYEPNLGGKFTDAKGVITAARWRHRLYNAVGNGVPVFMAEAFGRCYPPSRRRRRSSLWIH